MLRDRQGSERQEAGRDGLDSELGLNPLLLVLAGHESGVVGGKAGTWSEP